MNRPVALKYPSTEIMGNEERKQQFIREGKILASFNSPYICPVHELLCGDDKVCIVMSYVDGPSVRTLVENGPLDHEKVLEISIQVAEGLLVAHDKGIIHRDIKDDNIKINKDGRVQILDFGIAMSTVEAKGPPHTQIGVPTGTPDFMSPEQTRRQDLDMRTDVWSLGVVMYEMLTGQLPFKSSGDGTVIDAIQNSPPRSIRELSPDVSENLNRIIMQMLEKDPQKRPADMQAVIQKLNVLAT